MGMPKLMDYPALPDQDADPKTNSRSDPDERSGSSSQLQKVYDQKLQEFLMFENQARETRQVVDQVPYGSTYLSDHRIIGVYRTIKDNALRLAKTFYNSSIPMLQTRDGPNAGELGVDNAAELSADDRREQGRFFENWDHRGEIRVLRAAGKIFELLQDTLLEKPCFGLDKSQERALVDLEQSLLYSDSKPPQHRSCITPPLTRPSLTPGACALAITDRQMCTIQSEE